MNSRHSHAASHTKASPTFQAGPGWFVILLTVVGLQCVARFLPHAVTDFILDDWACMATAASVSSFSQILDMSWREAARPLALLSSYGFFYAFGDQPVLFAVLSVVMHSLALAIVVGIAFEVTGCRVRALVAGILFALLPTLTESFHWGQLISISHMLVGYLLCAYAWLRWMNGRGPAWLAVSYVAYAVSTLTYEAGLLLPAAGLALIDRSNGRRLFASLVPFGGLLGLYFAWRFLGWFGDKDFLQTGNYTAGHPTLESIVWNARQVVSWWAGARCFESVVQGFEGFGLIAKWPLRMMWVADIAIALLLVAWLSRNTGEAGEDTPDHRRWSDGRAAAFGLAFAGTGYALCLVSWTGGRLNFLPSAGVALVVAVLVARANLRRHFFGAVLVVFACLVACQGTIEQWHRAGDFNRRLYERLQATVPQWSGYDLIWVDTSNLRDRLSRGLDAEAGAAPSTWAVYGNAGLLRGFVIKAMMELSAPGRNRPATVFDVECDPVLGGDQLLWHRPWNPAAKEQTPLADVVRLDPLTLQLEPVVHRGSD